LTITQANEVTARIKRILAYIYTIIDSTRDFMLNSTRHVFRS